MIQLLASDHVEQMCVEIIKCLFTRCTKHIYISCICYIAQIEVIMS